MKTTIKNGKVYNEQGEVAVLYSPGYGAGWSTWNSNNECVFAPEIVQMVLDDADTTEIEDKAEEIFGDDFYLGGAFQLKIEWLKPGTVFRINEYDGHETVETEDNENWHIA